MAHASRILIYIPSSPRGEKSESRRLAGQFLRGYALAHPDNEIVTLDLWTEPLPAFDGHKAGAKMTVIGGAVPAGAEATAWRTVNDVFDRFNAADHYLFGVPMWNTGVPYVIKQFIDIITQPGLAFGFNPETGYTPLLKGKKAAVIYTSGVYPQHRPGEWGRDHQKTFFDSWLADIGITDVASIEFRPTLVTADAETARKVASKIAYETGFNF